MITRSPDNDADHKKPLREGFEVGQVAEQPFPTQADRAAMSKPHPRKRDVNRDFNHLPNGSLATDW